MVTTVTHPAVKQLLTAYTRLASKDPLPIVDPQDDEGLERLFVAICWAGDYCPYGYVHATFQAVHNLCDLVGVLHVEELIGFPEEDLQQLVLLSCPQIPDLTCKEAVEVLFRALTGLRNWWGNSPAPLTTLMTSDPDYIRDTVEDICPSVVPALYCYQALGIQQSKPSPTMGAALMLGHCGLIDYTAFFVGEGTLRLCAREFFETQPFAVQVMVELWMPFCSGHCPWCCCREVCDLLNQGLV